MPHPARQSAAIVIAAALIAGCGASPPSLEAVRANMADEQLAVGEPVANSVGMVFVPIPAGEFEMGRAPAPEKTDKTNAADKKVVRGQSPRKRNKKKIDWTRDSELPQHTVTLSQPFYLSVTEVTQQQYESVTGESPWRGKPVCDDSPTNAASYITWKDAAKFCRTLSEKENVTYRLPTEAEWEYACRAGTSGSFHFENPKETFNEHIWHKGNAYDAGEQYPHAVGQKLPNRWALHDMHGNVWEWCQDWYEPYPEDGKPTVDPTGPETGWIHVWRGGSFADHWTNLRSEARLSNSRPDYRPEYLVGFRVVREMEAAL